MKARIETLPEKKLLGKSLKMSLANNKTFELWSNFMKDKKNIMNTLDSNLYSIQVYDYSYSFKAFNPQTEFVKWAAIEVLDHDIVPKGFVPRILKKGLYAVFVHRGSSKEFYKTSQYIFREWLPNSEYELDQRDHFELLGEKYKNNDPNSEEEVWVPIKEINDMKS